MNKTKQEDIIRTVSANNFECRKKMLETIEGKEAGGSAHTHKKDKFETGNKYTFP